MAPAKLLRQMLVVYFVIDIVGFALLRLATNLSGTVSVDAVLVAVVIQLILILGVVRSRARRGVIQHR